MGVDNDHDIGSTVGSGDVLRVELPVTFPEIDAEVTITPLLAMLAPFVLTIVPLFML